MVTKDYKRIVDELRLAYRDIGELAQTSHVTVSRVLNESNEGICSKATRARIYDAIDQLVARKMDNLKRLSRGECVPA